MNDRIYADNNYTGEHLKSYTMYLDEYLLNFLLKIAQTENLETNYKRLLLKMNVIKFGCCC
jgi:hypothetical protein